MTSFKKLYHQLLNDTLSDNGKDYSEKKLEIDPHQLDCLLHPEKHPLVLRTEKCNCTKEQQEECASKCPFDAIKPGSGDGIEINPEECVGCVACVENCKADKLTSSTDIIPALRAVRNSKGPSYAIIAPAFLGQFSKEVTPGKLRSALKKAGFDGMIEVALFADILTLKEALEFDKNIVKESDYQLTSCCCPIWIAMIRKVYHELMPHVPGSVSPMIACGRAVKELYPDSTVVFIGPCLAKKAERKEPDLLGAVDFVLTFTEVQDIFDALSIDPANMPESEKDHSSRAGRIYARAGGVSEAVEATVRRLNPQRTINVRTSKADGVPGCREMLNNLKSGDTKANFFEGMGCKGGCVGGPKSILDTDTGRANVDIYGELATYKTPIDNPYVIELLHLLGFDTVESLLENSDIFTRTF